MTRKEYGVAVYLLLAVWAVAVVLLVLNNPLYRFLEGYAPPFPGRLAEWLKTRKRRRLQSWKHEIRALHDEWKEQGSAFPAPKRDRYQKLRRDLVKWMPAESYILPTRFGNAIRAFEVYPSEIYGADGVVIWPRLSSVMPKAFGDQIEEIRSQIDFLVNCCFFSATIAFLGFSRTIYSASYQDLHTTAGWFLWAVGGAIASYLFYRLAVTRVPAWGDLVRSAFDCYLPALAEQLGFELPPTEEKRRAFWLTFSQQLIYGRDPDGKTQFHVDKWKQAKSKSVNNELERGSNTQDGKSQESGDNNDSEDDPNSTEK